MKICNLMFSKNTIPAKVDSDDSKDRWKNTACVSAWPGMFVHTLMCARRGERACLSTEVYVPNKSLSVLRLGGDASNEQAAWGGSLISYKRPSPWKTFLKTFFCLPPLASKDSWRGNLMSALLTLKQTLWGPEVPNISKSLPPSFFSTNAFISFIKTQIRK